MVAVDLARGRIWSGTDAKQNVLGRRRVMMLVLWRSEVRFVLDGEMQW